MDCARNLIGKLPIVFIAFTAFISPAIFAYSGSLKLQPENTISKFNFLSANLQRCFNNEYCFSLNLRPDYERSNFVTFLQSHSVSASYLASLHLNRNVKYLANLPVNNLLDLSDTNKLCMTSERKLLLVKIEKANIDLIPVNFYNQMVAITAELQDKQMGDVYKIGDSVVIARKVNPNDDLMRTIIVDSHASVSTLKSDKDKIDKKKTSP